jgi:hypothetical protein
MNHDAMHLGIAGFFWQALAQFISLPAETCVPCRPCPVTFRFARESILPLRQLLE